MKTEIAECCRQLRLGKNIAQISDQVEAASHQEYLLKVLKEELACREIKRKNRLIKQAGFYSLKTFEGYCFDEIRLPAELSVADLKEADFISKKKNLILYGNVGTGKTHMATAIGVEACNQGRAVRFFRAAALVNQLSDAQKRGDLSQLLTRLSKAELLISMNGAMSL